MMSDENRISTRFLVPPRGLIFDRNGEIIVQHEMSTLKETETGSPQYEVKENNSSTIDFSQTLNDKLG